MPQFPLDKWLATQFVITDDRLTKLAKLIFARLVYHHNQKTNRCFPSVDTIAASLGCSGRSVRKEMRTLEKFNYVKVSKRRGRNGTNQYNLSIPTGKDAYVAAEEKRLEARNSPSAKHKKEQKKEQERILLRKEEKSLQSKRKESELTRLPKTQERLEGHLVNLLGGGEEGYMLAMMVDSVIIERMVAKVSAGAISLDEAVHEIVANQTADG